MQLSQINWGSVADWVSGFGTLTAALVALHLARRSERIRLRCYCGIFIIVGMGAPKRSVVNISATNVGIRGTVVNNVGLRVGFLKKRYAVINIVPTVASVGIPKELTDGQSANWHIPLDDEKSWLKDLCKSFIKRKSDIRSFRFTLHTNHGRDFVITPAKSFREALEQVYQAAEG